VYVYVPAGIPVIVVLVPVPVVVVPPGVLVKIHVPVAGKLLKETLPVAVAHVGGVWVPTVGVGITLIVIGKSLGELIPQLEVVVTLKVPEVAPAEKLTVTLLVLPVIVAPDPTM
jgi:hypothetical protein